MTQSNSSRIMDCSFNISPVIKRKKKQMEFYSENSNGFSELRKNLKIKSQKKINSRQNAIEKAQKVSELMNSRRDSQRRFSERKHHPSASNPIQSSFYY